MAGIGCLLLLLFIPAIAIVVAVLKGIFFSLDRIGGTAIWLWESFCNLFRSEKKETINPWTGKSNFSDGDSRQSHDISYVPTEVPEKRFSPSEGEYIDYQEL